MADKLPPRPSRGPGDKPKGRASVEKAMALRDAMSAAVDAEKEFRKASKPKPQSGAGRGVMLAFSFALMAFTLFAYMSRPEFIFGADPNNVPEVRKDANVRMTLFLLSREVEDFKKKQQKYPDDLKAIPGAPAGVRYALLTDTVFELRYLEGTKEVVFRSDAPVNEFLRDAPKILSGRDR